jgi:hypothetical protein
MTASTTENVVVAAAMPAVRMTIENAVVPGAARIARHASRMTMFATGNVP